MAQISLAIDFLFRLLARRPLLSAPAGAENNESPPVNPRRPSPAIRFFFILGKISRNWGPVGCWTALTYFIVRTGHGANMFRSLSNRLAESTFVVRLLSYLFRWFGRETGSIDHFADTIEHVGTFFRHAGAAFKSANDVVTRVSKGSTRVSVENNKNNNEDPRDGTAAVSTEVDSPRAANDNVQQTFSGDREVNHSARAEVQFRTISSIEEANEVISKWKEGGGGFSLDVPLTMPAQTAFVLSNYFVAMGAACLLDGPNVKSILEKELALARFDLEVATKHVAELQSLMRPSSSTDRKMDS